MIAVTAAPILLSANKPVTGSSYYDNRFIFERVTDGVLNDYDTGDYCSFWLTPSGQTGYVIIDLLDSYMVSKFEVQNTHNRSHNDRATEDFRISLSTDNVNYTTVVDDVLPVTFSSLPIYTYNINETEARYIRFDIDKFYSSSGGINELMIYGTEMNIPEVSNLILFIICLFGCRFVREKSRQ